MLGNLVNVEKQEMGKKDTDLEGGKKLGGFIGDAVICVENTEPTTKAFWLSQYTKMGGYEINIDKTMSFHINNMQNLKLKSQYWFIYTKYLSINFKCMNREEYKMLLTDEVLSAYMERYIMVIDSKAQYCYQFVPS